MFKTITINGTHLIKVDGRWCKEGGDGEMYAVVGQKEIDELYEKEQQELNKMK